MYSTQELAEQAQASYLKHYPENAENGIFDIEPVDIDHNFWEKETSSSDQAPPTLEEKIEQAVSDMGFDSAEDMLEMLKLAGLKVVEI